MPDTNKIKENSQDSSYLQKRRRLLKASAAAPLIATLAPNIGAAATSAFLQCAADQKEMSPQRHCGIGDNCASPGDTWKRFKVEVAYVPVIPTDSGTTTSSKTSKSAKIITDSKTSKSSSSSKSSKATPVFTTFTPNFTRTGEACSGDKVYLIKDTFYYPDSTPFSGDATKLCRNGNWAYVLVLYDSDSYKGITFWPIQDLGDRNVLGGVNQGLTQSCYMSIQSARRSGIFPG